MIKSHDLANRIHGIDWEKVSSDLDVNGYALTPTVLTRVECDGLVHMYSNDELFRSRVVMERHNFGRGEYRYFADPLPSIVETLRTCCYPCLEPIANAWAARLRQSQNYPPSLAKFLEVCAEQQQLKPTPLLLRYKEGDYNCLHQDIYGAVGFPLQLACVLSEVNEDYEGGEFLISEQRPRAQTRAEAITIRRGQCVVFPNHHRPAPGTRGDYRVNMRHGVSRLRKGTRYALGIIFHNAK